MNEYELPPHCGEYSFRKTGKFFTEFSSLVNRISDKLDSQQAATGGLYVSVGSGSFRGRRPGFYNAFVSAFECI
ncbi:MAG: hypothetical protein ACI8QT_001965 [Halioglobus sp.]|jgi:hypothetical protein